MPLPRPLPVIQTDDGEPCQTARTVEFVLKNTDMKKIMFNDRYGLTQAVIEGLKTMTRRVIKMNDAYERGDKEYWSAEDIRNWNNSFTSRILNATKEEREKCFEYLLNHPKYKVGEVVAVAQSYRDVLAEGFESDAAVLRAFEQRRLVGLTNKMFVRADLMPHCIRVTDVRVERLQDISDEDCLREGLQFLSEIGRYYFERTGCEGFYFDTPREAFASLIDKVSGRGTWESNPWVLAYEFELVK